MDGFGARMVGDAHRGGPYDEVDAEIEAIANQYVALTQGNVRLALTVSVADRIAATRLVSRGFARWGQPVPCRRLPRR